MTRIDDRPIATLDRTSALGSTSTSRTGEPTSTRDRQLPRGWGSSAERRLVRWGVAGFFLLATYAVAFVLLGALVWS